MKNFTPEAKTFYGRYQTSAAAAVSQNIASRPAKTHVVKGVYISCDQPPAAGLAFELTSRNAASGGGTATNTFEGYYSILDSGKYIPFPDGFYGNKGDAIHLAVAADAAAVIRTIIAYQ